jgi:hypothetical protein
MARTLDNILAAVDQMGSAKSEIDEGSASVRVGARVVAQIDLRRDQVLVNAPPDVIPALQRAFPSSRQAATGVVSTWPTGKTRPQQWPRFVDGLMSKSWPGRFASRRPDADSGPPQHAAGQGASVIR